MLYLKKKLLIWSNPTSSLSLINIFCLLPGPIFFLMNNLQIAKNLLLVKFVLRCSKEVFLIKHKSGSSYWTKDPQSHSVHHRFHTGCRYLYSTVFIQNYTYIPQNLQNICFPNTFWDVGDLSYNKENNMGNNLIPGEALAKKKKLTSSFNTQGKNIELLVGWVVCANSQSGKHQHYCGSAPDQSFFFPIHRGKLLIISRPQISKYLIYSETVFEKEVHCP